jgi:hypothetical protein
MYRRSALSRSNYYTTGNGERESRLTGMCLYESLCLCHRQTSLTPRARVWLAKQLCVEKDGHAAAGLRPTPLVAFLVIWTADVYAHDSYPCAAQEHSHEASGSNRLGGGSLFSHTASHSTRPPLRVRGRVVKSGAQRSWSPPCAGYPGRSICSERRAPFEPFVC